MSLYKQVPLSRRREMSPEERFELAQDLEAKRIEERRETRVTHKLLKKGAFSTGGGRTPVVVPRGVRMAARVAATAMRAARRAARDEADREVHWRDKRRGRTARRRSSETLSGD